jgi:hypothetical protein
MTPTFNIINGGLVRIGGAKVGLMGIVETEAGLVAGVGVGRPGRREAERLKVGQTMTVAGWGSLQLTNAQPDQENQRGHAELTYTPQP